MSLAQAGASVQISRNARMRRESALRLHGRARYVVDFLYSRKGVPKAICLPDGPWDDAQIYEPNPIANGLANEAAGLIFPLAFP